MSKEPIFQPRVDQESVAVSSANLHGYIARSLRVSALHLPWAVARQLHAEHETPAVDELRASTQAGLRLIELDDFSWRLDVTVDNIAATQALAWPELRRLLRLAQTYQCEALELAGSHPILPAALEFEIFAWP